MKCPSCNHDDTRVVDSRPEASGSCVRRRRECPSCSLRFSTLERVVIGNFSVIKQNGEVESFSLEKLEKSVSIACGKRPISEEMIRTLCRDIAEQWAGKSEVSSKDIGKSVMHRLQELDQVAYIRFASVYRKFKDVDAFKEEISKLF